MGGPGRTTWVLVFMGLVAAGCGSGGPSASPPDDVRSDDRSVDVLVELRSELPPVPECEVGIRRCEKNVAMVCGDVGFWEEAESCE
ncbi:MAG: hypothetical protein FJ109_09535, partial [Deltaproteobacteria bacterium]|nr:hypothetical protein [Deltaproteobacteria bacterium]